MTEEVIIPDLPGAQDSRELAVLRKQTLHFIRSNPDDIAFNRGADKVSDGAGGWTWGPGGATLEPQQMRLIPVGGRVQSRNVNGEEVTPAYVLIAAHDADVDMDDTFDHNGRMYEVIFIREDRRYETWLEVVYRG